MFGLSLAALLAAAGFFVVLAIGVPIPFLDLAPFS
jgi:hypothetical protein